MVAKRLMNKRKYVAEIYEHKKVDSEDDRPSKRNEFVRKAYYNSKSITSQEKYLSEQNKTGVVKRIEIIYDPKINEVTTRIEISGIMYKITRMWVVEREKRMELSLAYVDNKKTT